MSWSLLKVASPSQIAPSPAIRSTVYLFTVATKQP